MVKRVALLKTKKGREEQGLFVVEGYKMISDAISYGMEIEEIFVTIANENLFKNAPVTPILVSDSVFKCISDEVTPQGALAVLKIPKSGAISRLSRCLLLDRVQDPGNVGTIMRLATACGVKDVLLIDSADPYSPKAVRSSMSGIYRVNVIKVSEGEALSLLQKNGVPEEKIIPEDKSRFTAQNAWFTKAILADRGMELKKAIICCKAFHARRCLMYYQFTFPETEFIMVPVKDTHEGLITKENWYLSEIGVKKVLGELSRIGTQFMPEFSGLGEENKV